MKAGVDSFCFFHKDISTCSSPKDPCGSSSCLNVTLPRDTAQLTSPASPPTAHRS